MAPVLVWNFQVQASWRLPRSHVLFLEHVDAVPEHDAVPEQALIALVDCALELERPAQLLHPPDEPLVLQGPLLSSSSVFVESILLLRSMGLLEKVWRLVRASNFLQ
jgi:hypothetical protein